MKRIVKLLCPFCTNPVAVADPTTIHGFRRSEPGGKVKFRGEILVLKCPYCERVWDAAKVKLDKEGVDGEQLPS